MPQRVSGRILFSYMGRSFGSLPCSHFYAFAYSNDPCYGCLWIGGPGGIAPMVGDYTKKVMDFIGPMKRSRKCDEGWRYVLESDTFPMRLSQEFGPSLHSTLCGT